MDTTERKYNLVDMIFALIAFGIGILGYFTVENGFALGCGLFFSIASIGAILYCIVKKEGAIEWKGVVMLSVSIILSFGFSFGERNFILLFFNFFLCLWAFFYGIYVLFGNRSDKNIGKLFLYDTLKVSFLMPFSSLGSFFGALFAPLKKSGTKKVGYAFLGLFLAIIPSIVVCNLLANNDPAFDSFISSISTSFEFESFLTICFYSLIIAIFGFSFIFSAKEKKHKDVLSQESYDEFITNYRKADQTFVYFTIIPLIAIYIVFLFSQLSYFTSTFSGILPEGETFSSCARRGFFEVCTVAFINGIMIFMMGLFTKRNEDKKSVSQKVFSTILSVLTLGLLSVSMSKMLLYIQEYGLTQKRFYTMVIMSIMCIIFILSIIKQYYDKLNAISISVILCICFFCFILYFKPSEFIASYNIDRYLNGIDEKLDIDAMYDLTDGAGIEKLIVSFDDIKDEDTKDSIIKYISNYVGDLRDNDNFLQYYKTINVKKINEFLKTVK